MDYDDDEDDEDYKPPPRRQAQTSDADDGVLDAITLKRKLGSKGELGQIKKQRIDRNPKAKDSVFAALCSTISQAVNKKAANVMHTTSRGGETKKNPEKENPEANKAAEACRSSPEQRNCSSNDDREEDTRRNCSDEKQNTSEDVCLEREDCPSLPSNSSPEMAVNGS